MCDKKYINLEKVQEVEQARKNKTDVDNDEQKKVVKTLNFEIRIENIARKWIYSNGLKFSLFY